MRDSVIVYESFYDAVKDLDPEAFKDCMCALFEYAYHQKDTAMTPTAKMFIKLIKPQVDANNRRYLNGTKGGRPKNQTETKEQTKTNLIETEKEPKKNQSKTKPEPNVNDNDNDNVNGNDINRFQKPTIEELAMYCKERNLQIDPYTFMDYYDSNGWMVGKNKMKDWKATARRWNREPVDSRRKKIPNYMTEEQVVQKPTQKEIDDVKKSISKMIVKGKA